jgi:hypothetical protein
MPSFDGEIIGDLAEQIRYLTDSIDKLVKQMKRQGRITQLRPQRQEQHADDIAAYWRGARGRDVIDPHVAHQLRLMTREYDVDLVRALVDIAISRMQAGDSDARVFKYLNGILRNQQKDVKKLPSL